LNVRILFLRYYVKNDGHEPLPVPSLFDKYITY
jgi:hypothetical protein